MPDNTTLDSLASALESGFRRVDERCTDLSTSIAAQGEKLDAVRLAQATQAERWTGHFAEHKRLDVRINGIESREREDATGRVDVSAHAKAPTSDAPRPGWLRVAAAVPLRTWLGAAVLCASLMLAGGAYFSEDEPSPAVAAKFEKLTRLLAALEPALASAAAAPAAPAEDEQDTEGNEQ